MRIFFYEKKPFKENNKQTNETHIVDLAIINIIHKTTRQTDKSFTEDLYFLKKRKSEKKIIKKNMSYKLPESVFDLSGIDKSAFKVPGFQEF